MDLISPLDAMCLLAESREHPLHVGGLQLFTPPPGAGSAYMRETYESMLACDDVVPLFRRQQGGAVAVAPGADDGAEDDALACRTGLEYESRCTAMVPDSTVIIRCQSCWTCRRSTSRWQPAPAASISGSLAAGAACRTCSVYSITWRAR